MKQFLFLIFTLFSFALTAQEEPGDVTIIQSIVKDTVVTLDTTYIEYYLQTVRTVETGFTFPDESTGFIRLGDSTAAVKALYVLHAAGDPQGTGWQAFYTRMGLELYFREARVNFNTNTVTLFDSIGHTNVFDVIMDNNRNKFEGRWRIFDGLGGSDTYELFQANSGTYFLRLESDNSIRYTFKPRHWKGFELRNFPVQGDVLEMVYDPRKGSYRPLGFQLNGTSIKATFLGQ